jgi:Ca2+-binding EF-hand superfamily protein
LQLQVVKDAFAYYDRDSQGSLDLPKLTELLLAAGLDLPDQMTAQVI